MKVYVDDGRQATSLLRKGMRFSKEEMEFRWDMEAEQEDIELEKKRRRQEQLHGEIMSTSYECYKSGPHLHG